MKLLTMILMALLVAGCAAKDRSESLSKRAHERQKKEHKALSDISTAITKSPADSWLSISILEGADDPIACIDQFNKVENNQQMNQDGTRTPFDFATKSCDLDIHGKLYIVSSTTEADHADTPDSYGVTYHEGCGVFGVQDGKIVSALAKNKCEGKNSLQVYPLGAKCSPKGFEPSFCTTADGQHLIASFRVSAWDDLSKKNPKIKLFHNCALYKIEGKHIISDVNYSTTGQCTVK